MNELTDDSIMKFGEHKGKKLANVPEHYLIWWYKENLPLIEYIEDSIDHSKLEIE